MEDTSSERGPSISVSIEGSSVLPSASSDSMLYQLASSVGLNGVLQHIIVINYPETEQQEQREQRETQVSESSEIGNEQVQPEMQPEQQNQEQITQIEVAAESTPVQESTRMEFQLFLKWLENCLPFLFLLLVLFLYQHRNGIIYFIWHFSVFYYMNNAVKQQIILKENRQVSLLLIVITILGFHILATYLFFQSGQLWRSLLLFPPKDALSVWDVMWLIIINDFMVRFFTMIMKCCIVIFLVNTPPKQRGQLFAIIEILSHIYRSLLPIPIWFTYLMNEENGYLLPCMLAGLYLTFKLTGMLRKVRIFATTVRAFALHEVPFGQRASLEEVAEIGDMCAICQEKMIAPVKLNCTHIFCEACVSEWFEKNKTCPLCRAVVKCTGLGHHFDGGTSLLFQLF